MLLKKLEVEGAWRMTKHDIRLGLFFVRIPIRNQGQAYSIRVCGFSVVIDD